MEILEVAQVTKMSWWFIASVITLTVCIIFAIIAAANNTYLPMVMFVIIALAAIAVIVIAPITVPTDEMHYTIEITDPAQYQILVEKGYSFKRLFENKEIYTIIGDVLK